MKNKLVFKFLNFLIFFTLTFFFIFCEKRNTVNISKTDFFENDSLIVFDLKFNLEEFEDYNEGKRYYHYATMSYVNSESQKIVCPLRIKLHGQFRVDTNYCNMPQLKLNFEKNGAQKELFGEIDKLFLVMACQKNVEEFQNFVIEEYLIYKMYNILTEYSFQVRLAKVNLINTANLEDTISSFAFFREHTDDFAKRLNGKMLETVPVNMSKINKPLLDKIVLFNYVIENQDWEAETMHNIKIICKNDSSLYPVAYDFDFAKMIYTPYSSFDSTYFSTELRNYLYSNNEVIELLKSDFIKNKNSYLQVFEQDKYLLKEVREKDILFLKNSFNKLINL